MSILAVAVGGVLGTLLRLSIDWLLPHGGTGFPVSTLLINVVGSFVLGAAVARLWPVIPSWQQAALGPGLLGSFTTFSAIMVMVVDVGAEGQLLLGLAYLAVTVIAGLLAAAVGLRLGGRPAVPPLIEVNE